MQTRTSFARTLFFLFLSACLLTGMAGAARTPAQAAPMMQAGTADLSLAMTVNNAAPNKADSVIFTVTVTNNSTTDTATGVVVQDILPAGLQFVSSSGPGAYNSATGDWTPGDLGAGANAVLTLTTRATSIGAQTNTATITVTNPIDPDLSNNSASVTVTPRVANLSLTMDPQTNLTPNKADPVVFTIRVTNSGPNAATGVTVRDVLPAGFVYVSDSGGGTYNRTSGIWVVGTVPNGGSVFLNIITNASASGPLTNSAEILTSDQLDPNSTPGSGPTPPEDDYITSSPAINPNVADLNLTKTVDNPGPSIGDIVTFTITVINTGPAQATGVRVTDILPAGLTFLSYTSTNVPSGSGGTYTVSTGNWSVGTLNSGGTKILTIRASVTSTAPKTNTATITESDQIDTNSADNSASVSLNTPAADLAVAITASNPTPNKADNVVFTITVTNNGPANATGVTIRALLPAGMQYVSNSGAPGIYDPANSTWQVGSLPNGSSAALDITARATTTGAKVNTASVLTSNQADLTPGNNSASVTVTPRSADLSILKTVDANAPNPGDTVRFRITLTNSGPDAASGVLALDSLPNGYTYVSDDGGGAYSSGSGVWTIGNMPSGTSRTLNITTTATTGSTKTNSVEVIASEQLDPDSTPNNSAIAEDDYNAAPKVDLSLAVTASTTIPGLGSSVVLTLRVTNAGPAAATGVVVRNLLPPGLTYVSNNGGAVLSGGAVVWPAGTLGVGATRTLTITVTGSAIGAFSNYAEVTAVDQFDIDSAPGNNSTTEDDDETLAISVSYPAMTLLINEVAWMGTAASVNDEWIELYNPGTTPVTLTGWVLRAVDGTPTITLPSGFTLNPGQFFLLERTDDTTVSDILADLIYTGELGNSNETLQLLDPLSRVVDSANLNGGAWPAGSSTTFGTMERRGVLVDSDTAWITNTGVVTWGKDAGTPNDCTLTPPCLTAPKTLWGTPKRANWAASVTPTPSPSFQVGRTPTATPVPPPPPPLVAINEFVPRPGSDWNNDGVINTGDEYIELLNHGVIDVNLGGYRLDDEANIGSTPFNLPSVTIKPGERLVFYGSQTGLLLSDGGDGVRLLKPNGQLADAYNYSVVKFPDQAFCRLPDNGGADDWTENCFPTPGLKNSLSGTSLRPPTEVDEDRPLCPIADTLPEGFVLAECAPFGNNIWSRFYWDKFGWFGGKSLPNVNGKWEVFAD